MPALEAGHVVVAAGPIIGAAPLVMRDFVSLFGVSPKVCAAVWNITSFDDDVKLQHLLWALLFLKTYQTETPLMKLANCTCRKTFRKYVWKVLSALRLKSTNIVSRQTTCLYFQVFSPTISV
jgi:hypothetical protein